MARVQHLAVCLWLGACIGRDVAETAGFETAGGTGLDREPGATQGGPSTGDISTSVGGDEVEASGEPPVLDVAPETGSDGGPASGCEKIDFLFAIDNSQSMLGSQEKLINAFPGFISAIRERVEGDDHHIMVVDGDTNPAYVCEEVALGNGATWCDGGLPDQPGCDGYTCGDVALLAGCDLEFGAGVTAPYGGNTNNGDCGFPSGRRYLIETDEELEDRFACAAQVGTSGWPELPTSAALTAVGGPQAELGACNEGFLREDAILVLTIVSDDLPLDGGTDDVSAGVPEDWYEELVAAKGGNADAIVVVGMFRFDNGSCNVHSSPQILIDFVDLFGDRGLVESTCASDYVSVFEDAVDVVDQACDEFEPPG